MAGIGGERNRAGNQRAGMFNCCRAAVPHMRARGGGWIVNISSLSSTGPFANGAAYCASKAALVGLTKAVARDFIRSGVRANAICPGTIQSPSLDERIAALAEMNKTSVEAARQAFIDRQPMGRIGTAEEVALLATYLASDESAYTVGSDLMIDGGMGNL